MSEIPRLPPLSGSKYKCRTSKSLENESKSVEWFLKLATGLPKLWVRDIDNVTWSTVENLRTAWQQHLNKSNGDKRRDDEGSGWSARSVEKRKGLKKEIEAMKNLGEKNRRKVALARFKHFAIVALPDGNGGWNLDYHTATKEEIESKAEKKGGETTE